jgi:hypothetical protein
MDKVLLRKTRRAIHERHRHSSSATSIDAVHAVDDMGGSRVLRFISFRRRRCWEPSCSLGISAVQSRRMYGWKNHTRCSSRCRRACSLGPDSTCASRDFARCFRFGRAHEVDGRWLSFRLKPEATSAAGSCSRRDRCDFRLQPEARPSENTRRTASRPC